MRFDSAATIAAPAERIWSILTDASAWPEFDPNCERVEGQIEAGSKVKVFTRLSPGRAFPVKVSMPEPGRLMVWTGGMPLGMFKGERTFTLTPAGSGTDFAMTERFSGPLLGLIGRTIPDMTLAFKQFADGLKRRAENSR